MEKIIIPTIALFLLITTTPIHANTSENFKNNIESITREKTEENSTSTATSSVNSSEKLANSVKKIVSKIYSFQKEYFDLNGYYWGSTATHTVTPEYNSPTAPDLLSYKPEGINLSWNDTSIKLKRELPFSVSVVNFQAPIELCPLNPFGYYIILETISGDSLFTKTISDKCPGVEQTTDWH